MSRRSSAGLVAACLKPCTALDRTWAILSGSIVIRPGAIVSEWNGIARDGLARHSGEGAYRDSARAYARFMTSADRGWLPSPPSVVARTIVRAVEARRPRTRYAIGGGARSVLFLRRVLSDRGFDALMLMGARPGKATA